MQYYIDLQRNKRSKDGSILSKVQNFQVQLKIHEEGNYNILKKSPLISACDREVTYYDRHSRTEKKAIMFGSNNYLGTVLNEKAIKEAHIATEKYGIGSGGVPLLSGTNILQNKLERTIAQTKGFDDSIIFSSGFAANLGVLVGLLNTDNIIIHDKLNHASLIDGSIMSGAKIVRYKHQNLKDLEKLLIEYSSKFPNGILVVTDGVFSMDGDIANLPRILELVNKYNALLLIDDAHATGVIGEKGRGTLSHHNIKQRQNIIVSGTLSKAIGTVGGFITAQQDIIDYLRIYSRSNMYSTSLPPSVLSSSNWVFEHILDTDIVYKLNEKAYYLRNRLKESGFNILNSETTIIPVIVKNQYVLTQLSKELLNKGIIANYIFPPVVPPNLTRIRISVMATHTKEDLDYLVYVLNELDKEYHFKYEKENTGK